MRWLEEGRVRRVEILVFVKVVLVGLFGGLLLMGVGLMAVLVVRLLYLVLGVLIVVLLCLYLMVLLLWLMQIGVLKML